METYKVTFEQKEQDFLFKLNVKVLIDDKMLCDLSVNTGDYETVEIPYGKHHLTLIGRWKNSRVDKEIFVRESGTIRLKWDSNWGRPEILDIGNFDIAFDIAKRKADNVSISEDGSKIIITKDKETPLNVAFGATIEVGNFLWLNENKRLVAVPKRNLFGKIIDIYAFRYEDILDFDLLQDGSYITNKGGLGRATVGGALFGGSGAIVGALTGERKHSQICTDLRIKISLKDARRPCIFIDFIRDISYTIGSTKYRSLIESAETAMSLLKVITTQCLSNMEEPCQKHLEQLSNADELRKYKTLMDDGIISQEEFDAKKRQLLGL